MLSVIIIAKNEASNIKRCLESVAFSKEIIVLDSGSQDNTIDIAKAYTPHVFSTDWQGYGVQKQRALSYATQPWVLNLDADEWVSEALKKQIEVAIQLNTADAFRIPIAMNFYGKPLKFSQSPTRHVRLFKREGAAYSSDIVHEKIILPKLSRIKRLSAPIEHHSFQDLSHVLYKINRYSSYSAKIRLERNHSKPSFLKIFIASHWMFLRSYILQGGFLDGKAGLLLAIFNAQGTFYRGMKQLYPDRQLENLPKIDNLTGNQE